jgi:hypothetical protein
VNEEQNRGKVAAAAISRREFARRAALASAMASMAPASALTAEPFPSETSGSGSANALSQTAMQAGASKLSPESQSEVEARVQAILSQYGSRFSAEQKGDIHRLCELAQPPLDRLRAYALENGDNPALYLKPLVEREKNPLENTRVGKTPSAAKP